jgi:hypothetical protein
MKGTTTGTQTQTLSLCGPLLTLSSLARPSPHPGFIVLFLPHPIASEEDNYTVHIVRRLYDMFFISPLVSSIIAPRPLV